MRPFQIHSDMRTIGGKFYPTGWMVLLFPTEQLARDAARKLSEAGIPEDRVMLMTPADFQREISGMDNDEGLLPSPGTEGATARHIGDLMARGHHGLFVHAPDHDASERVMQILGDTPISFGQKYRKLVIEDIVE